jgi:hypothetical protein
MATVGIIGLTSPLPSAANTPSPIIGANGLGQFIGLTSPLPQAANTPISIVTPISASVVALLFPNAGGGGSFGGPI